MRTSSWLRDCCVVSLLLLVWPNTANTCAPEFPRAVFIRASGPDEPLHAFSNGRIGVPLPTWRRAYLAITYRYLSGKPLTSAERSSFLEFWSGERTPEYGTTTGALNAWFKARAKYRKEPPPTNVSAWRYGDSTYERYMNCLPNAFETAARTLRDRANRYGESSPELQEWIIGQDKVFQNCGQGAFVPPPAPANASALLRADRAYQIGAAYFYSGNRDEAVRVFDTIAADRNSPWHTLAPYLAVRTLIRSYDQKEGMQVLNTAEQRLQAILADPTLAAVHRDARRLQGFILFRLHPLERQHELARLLVSSRSGDGFGQNLLDYCLLLDKFLDEEPDFPGVDRWTDAYRAQLRSWKRKRYSELKSERANDLSDWLMTVQSDTRAAQAHAIERWKATGSRAWLFAVASRISGKEAISEEVLRHLSDIPATSPSYAAFAYHRARLLREGGRASVALPILNEALRHQETFPASAINLLKDEQMMSSSDLREFVSKLWRQPVQVSYGADVSAEEPYCDGEADCNVEFYGTAKPARKAHLLPQFDVAAAEVLNQRLPLDLLAQITQSAALPDNLRQKAIPAVWARAALLGNIEIAQIVAGDAAKARPETASFLNSYAAAGSDEERRFAAVFSIMHFPGLRPFVDSAYPRTTAFSKIDNYRDNWWCADAGGSPKLPNFYKQDSGRGYYGAELEGRDPTPEADYPAFLNEDQKARAQKEWQQLLSLGLPMNYFSQVTLNWARMHPDDPRVPEALHYAWRTQRWGCEDGKVHNYSHDLFNLLHRRYPTSEWTRKTTVWW